MAEGMEPSKSEDLWTPYKELHKTINFYLSESNQNVNVGEFETILRKYKQNFFALLKNPAKSIKSRDELKKGMEDGITVKEIGHQVLSKDLYQEAIILSDLYDLNEFVALDLLCTAQIQMPYYYALPRGLVAVILYYEGRNYLVSSLKLLVQARKGVSWSLPLNEGLINFITTYTDHLMASGIFNRIFELLRTLDLNKEMEKLRENVALGGPRHRRQVTDLFNDIRENLAEIVFLWSCQCGLPKEPTVGLINHLRQLQVEEDATGVIDNVTFLLLLALLSAMDMSIIHIREDGAAVIQKMPILADKDYLEMLCTELSPSKPKWVSEGLQGTSTFGLAVTTACVRLVPQCSELIAIIDKEVIFLCSSIEMKVFEFLTHKVFNVAKLYTDQIYMRRIHYLFGDFIVQMFPKVRELRIKADETARMMQVYIQEGLEPPANLPRHFEYFMGAITKFYSKDPLNTHYSADYWCPIDVTTQESYSYRAAPRSVSLFNFIRIAGDLIPSMLFVPFLDMLSSLSSCGQAARYCFNMLKQSGAGYNNTISWDHFFMSFNRYYSNLRQEVPPMTDTVYRRAIHHKGITPQEIEGLQSVARLIRKVAEHDDFSRLALCEHQGWAPLSIFLGLVGCSVPIPFKADLLLTLAALSKSPETSMQMWNSLEASQILVTVPTTSNYQPRGIQTELDEVESRSERYPLTRALLKLLDVLTDFGIPRTLGAGPRRPGFDPYLTFIVNSVFLKFNMRTYQNNEERWLIGAACLKLLEKFLLQYEPQQSDFPTSSNKPNEFNSPPGFHLMLQMNTKSEFLNLILHIIEEGQKVFQQYTPLLGQKYVEECTLRCLNIIERALTLQNSFVHLSSTSSNPIILTSLSKLLLMINPRSGQPDYCLNIIKYVCHQYFLPQHSLSAVNILVHVTAAPSLHTQFLNILLSNDKESKLIRSGFVECLDGSMVRENGNASNSIKETILKLIKQCLNYSSGNLSHFLLGFDIKHDISLTLFQQPGVLDLPRNCLHSIFTVLKCACCGIANSPTTLESAYHLLYLLSAGFKTAEPVLRFIRQISKFFQEHLSFCAKNAHKGVLELNQLSWLLKIIALELKLMSNRNQTFYLQQLTKMLVGIPNPSQATFVISNEDYMENIKLSNLLIKLLYAQELHIEEIPSLKWNYFENSALAALLNNCQTESKIKLIDVKKLHHILIDEMASFHASSAVGQRQSIMQEIQRVLVHSININNNRNAAASIIRFINSWRQVVEVLVIYMPFEVLTTKEQQILDICLLETIYAKIAKIPLLPEVGIHLSGVVLILAENLRKTHAKQQNSITTTDENQIDFKLIINNLVKWIVISANSSQDQRINLYAALVTFLQLIHTITHRTTIQTQQNFYVSRLDSSKFVSNNDSTIDIFLNFGEKLIELVCYDCISGHDAIRSLAMCALSLLIRSSGNVNWIVYMETRGYLKNIVESILNSDDDLLAALDPVPRHLKALYLYQSKMSLLSQLATTKIGSELLLESRILSCLSSMKVFTSHPEIVKQSQVPLLEDFIPSIGHRYLQTFLPTLHFCNSILTSLSTENLSAIEQIIYFLTSHLDVIEFVLRSGLPLLAQEFLEELACLTSVIARTATVNLTFIFRTNEAMQDNRGHLLRIQKLMLALLPKFLLTNDIVRDLSNSQQQQENTSNRLLYTFQILSNLIMYSRNLIESNSIDHSSVLVIFQPLLGNVFTTYNNRPFGEQSPTLGIIIQHLINTVNYYHEERATVSFLQRKKNEVATMSNLDLKEFLSLSPQVFDVTIARENAQSLVVDRFKKKTQELEYCDFIIDNSLYILWAHLDYYMLRAIPRIKADLSTSFNMEATLASASEATWKVSADDISNLKQGLVTIFNDSFSRQLIETAQDGSEVKTQFIETLLRKIKRLIQFVPVK